MRTRARGMGYVNCGKLGKKQLRRVFHSSHSRYYYHFQERGNRMNAARLVQNCLDKKGVRSVKTTQSRRRLKWPVLTRPQMAAFEVITEALRELSISPHARTAHMDGLLK